MSLRRSLQQHHGLLTATSSAFFKTSRPIFAAQQCRHEHTVPPIGAFDEQFVKNGVGRLLSDDAFRVAWTEYQKLMVDKLNNIIENKAPTMQNWDIKTLMLNVARNPNAANLFNYASMAHNNHFFFQGLSPVETEIPPELLDHLNHSFGSLETFRNTFLASAASMFGPGFTWLVQDRNPALHDYRVTSTLATNNNRDRPRLHFKILNTYLAGSPYPGAHRQQSIDMNVQNVKENYRSADDYARMNTVQNSVGAFGAANRPALGTGSSAVDMMAEEPNAFGGASLVPVLCVNTWPHVWLVDWGVAGKYEFLEQWWHNINWDHAWSLCRLPGPRRTFGDKPFVTG